MTRYVALLRGINVGKNKRVAMAELRALLTDLGHADVNTVLQSGNAVLTADGTSPEHLAGQIEQAVESELGLTVSCLVRTAEELRAVVEANPLTGTDGSRLMVAFLSAEPDPAVISGLDPAAFAPEEFHFHGRELYLWFPDGVLESPLAKATSEKKLGVTATVRNWNTVTKLLTLAEA